MKSKQLIIVVIAFVALGVIFMMQKSGRRDVVEGIGYDNVLGGTLATSDIAGFKCYGPGGEEEAVHVVKVDDKWIVKSRFDAPAQEKKVNDLLKKLKDMEGEKRSSSADVLADYEIGDVKAIHLHLLDNDGQDKKHLLLGKQGGNWQQSFIRLNGSNDVYLARANLRSDFALYGEQAKPESKPWCELSLMQVQKDDIAKIELQAPHRTLTLELREKPAPMPEGATGVAPPPITEWVMTSPMMVEGLMASGITKITGAFASVTASEVVARGNLEEYGLETPVGSCKVTDKSGTVHTLLFGNPVPAAAGALYVTMGTGDLVYKVDSWKLNSILVKMSELTNVTAPALEKDAVSQLSLQVDGREFKMAKQGEVWKMTQPAIKRELQSEAISKLLLAASSLNPQDVIANSDRRMTGLDKPTSVATCLLDDGSTFTLRLGGMVPLTDEGRFVSVNQEPKVWTIDKTKAGDLSPAISDMFNLDLFDFSSDDATAITLSDASGELSLALEGSPANASGESSGQLWQRKGAAQPVDQGAVSAFLLTLSGLSANDLFAKVENSGINKPTLSVKVTLRDGKSVELKIGNVSQKTGYYAAIGAETDVFNLSSYSAATLMEQAGKLRE
jgi:Domain of unknown function (DUF4340)